MAERARSAMLAVAGLTLAAAVALTAAPSPAWARSVAGVLRVEAPDGVVLELGDGRRFLGTLELRATDEGALLVNELDMDAYVEGVAEMPTRWHLEALKAQAVAARTYAWYSIRLDTFPHYDICATVACQVFRGADVVLGSSTGERWRQAVQDTSGEVLVGDDGLPILARYFSTSGGRTYPNEVVFPGEGPRPYLVGTDDPADAVSPYHRWRAVFQRDELDEILGRGETLGAAVPLATIEREGSVHDPTALVRVTGRDGSTAAVSARDFREFVSRVAPSAFPDRFPGRRADGLRPLPDTLPSSRFEFEVTDDEVVVHGRGWGHGVGMGQYGAMGRAEQGQTYDDILAAYYDGLRPRVSPELPPTVRVGMDLADEVRVRGDGPVRLVAGGEVLEDRALGTWTFTRAGATWEVAPPEGHDAALEVAPTRAGAPLPGDDDRAIVVETEVNKPAMLRLEVTDGSGATVYRRDLGVAEPGRHAATWRHEDDDGFRVPAGSYDVALLAEDAGGATAGTPLQVTVARSGGGLADDLGPAASLVRPLALVALAGAMLVGLVALGRRRSRRAPARPPTSEEPRT